MEPNLKDLKDEFNDVARVVAELSINVKEKFKSLPKSALLRVTGAYLDYPMQPEKPFMGEDEIEAYKVAIGLKESQMKLAFRLAPSAPFCVFLVDLARVDAFLGHSLGRQFFTASSCSFPPES